MTQTLIVTTLDDVVDSTDGVLSLREAISLANADSDDYNITFDSSIVGGSNTVVLTNGTLSISSDITIDGDVNGDDIADITISGTTQIIRLFSGDSQLLSLNIADSTDTALRIDDGASLIIEDSLFTNNSGTFAGAIDNRGTLTVNDSTLSNNSSTFAAGISNRGVLTVNDSTVSNNSSSFVGGISNLDTGTLTIDNTVISDNIATSFTAGVSNRGSAIITNSIFLGNDGDGTAAFENRDDGTAMVINSTFSNNIGDSSGGITNRDNAVIDIINTTISNNEANSTGGFANTFGATATLTNTTISGNTANTFTGGVTNSGDLTLNSSTVFDNYGGATRASNNGVGGINNSASLTLINSVVAGNIDGANPLADDISGTVQFATNSFIGTVESIATNVASINGGGDPMLGALLDNGGAVLTHSPLFGSILVGIGDASLLPADIFDIDGDGNITESLPFDARGQIRALGGVLDIGAVQLGPIIGSSGNDILEGGPGNDTIDGRAGDDILNGFEGNDTLLGDDGNDTLNGGEGDDTIDGGDGTDIAVYIGLRRGFDVSETAGVLTVVDTITTIGADLGTDSLTNVEHLQFTDGTFTVASFLADNVIDGTSGADVVLQGSTGDDIINGLGGDDTINASLGDDSVFGGDGDDILGGGAGQDALNGGDGTDTATYSNSDAAVIISLTDPFGQGGHAEGDVLVSIENLFGSRFADVLSGDSNDNTLNGFIGNDVISGGDGGNNSLLGGFGDDIFLGGDGNDFFNGGTGSGDLIDYSASSEGVTAQLGGTQTFASGDADGDSSVGIEDLLGSDFDDNLVGNTLSNEINGGDGDDFINASSGNDVINGGAGDDFLAGSRGADIIDGGAGSDTASYSNADGRVIVDLALGTVMGSGHGSGETLTSIENLFGSLFNDDLFGDDNDNVLDGFTGSDDLFGRGGNDTLIGGGGVDFLNGGSGDDILTGSGGFDRFIFNTAEFGQDVITDFTNNRELIDFRGSGLTFADLIIQVSGGDTIITIDGDPNANSITLEGVTSLIDANDFFF